MRSESARFYGKAEGGKPNVALSGHKVHKNNSELFSAFSFVSLFPLMSSQVDGNAANVRTS